MQKNVQFTESRYPKSFLSYEHLFVYHDSNALALCFENVDIKWYHLLPTPLEFEHMVNHLVLLVLST